MIESVTASCAKGLFLNHGPTLKPADQFLEKPAQRFLLDLS
jgi:hypothetical protein